MSIQVTNVGKGSYANYDRGIIVPVEGLAEGKPFKAEVYLGTAHNCTESQIIEGDIDLSEHGGDLTLAAQECEAYQKFLTAIQA
jgi:hypothetical protein